MNRFDIPLVAEGLTAYASSAQASYPSSCRTRQDSLIPPRLLSPSNPLRWASTGAPLKSLPPWAEQRRFWTDAILQGMARLEGRTPDPKLMERFDRRLEEARGCAAVEIMPLTSQRELVRNLRCFVSALEDTGDDRKQQVAVLRELFEDMAVQPSWDRFANGVDLAIGEAKSALLRMTERKPICFTRILLGGEIGPGGEAFVSGSVTGMEAVRGTKLFNQLTREHPEVSEWPAICMVYCGGGRRYRGAGAGH